MGYVKLDKIVIDEGELLKILNMPVECDEESKWIEDHESVDGGDCAHLEAEELAKAIAQAKPLKLLKDEVKK